MIGNHYPAASLPSPKGRGTLHADPTAPHPSPAHLPPFLTMLRVELSRYIRVLLHEFAQLLLLLFLLLLEALCDLLVKGV